MREEYTKKMYQALLKYEKAKADNKILMLEFVTLPDYLFKLQSGTQILARLENRAMYYLAAAVSDFFIPSQKMVRISLFFWEYYHLILVFFFY